MVTLAVRAGPAAVVVGGAASCGRSSRILPGGTNVNSSGLADVTSEPLLLQEKSGCSRSRRKRLDQ